MGQPTMAIERIKLNVQKFYNFLNNSEKHEMREIIKSHVLYSTNAPFNNLFREHRVAQSVRGPANQLHSQSTNN